MTYIHATETINVFLVSFINISSISKRYLHINFKTLMYLSYLRIQIEIKIKISKINPAFKNHIANVECYIAGFYKFKNWNVENQWFLGYRYFCWVQPPLPYDSLFFNRREMIVVNTRKSSCRKLQELYRSQHILFMACPTRGRGYPILIWLAGGGGLYPIPVLAGVSHLWPGCIRPTVIWCKGSLQPQ